MNTPNEWLLNYKIAHRGLHDNNAPENSLQAFTNAISKGYAIELDVQKIKDDKIIVFHDDTLCRLTKKDGYVSNLTKQDLSDLQIKNSTHTIPRLEEALELINGQVPILIETKNKYMDNKLENLLISILKNYNGAYAIQSFNPYSLLYIKNNFDTNIPLGLLGTIWKKESGYSMCERASLNKLKILKVFKPDFVSYDYNHIKNKLIQKLKNQGIPIIAYTIKSKTDFDKIKPYCDNIIFENFLP